jgi:hypothetical protein
VLQVAFTIPYQALCRLIANYITLGIPHDLDPVFDKGPGCRFNSVVWMLHAL